MIVVELCARAVLTPELVSALLETVAAKVSDATARNALLCTVLATQTQPMTSFPVSAFRFLVKIRYDGFTCYHYVVCGMRLNIGPLFRTRYGERGLISMCVV